MEISWTIRSWNCFSSDVGFDLDTGRLVTYESSCLKVFVRLEVQETVPAIVEGYDFLFV